MKVLLLPILSLCLLGTQAQTLEQTAGIYYAYPAPTQQQTPPPEGFEPIYISHYGRHGSRWITDDDRYTKVFDEFQDTANLTPLGMDVRRRLEIVLDDAIGRSGSLSPVGERQHQEIAQRMYDSFPGVFADSAAIDAVSSTSLRCAMSMGFFTERLKELNPALRISRTAYPKDMDYIAYESPEGKAFSSKSAQWRTTHAAFSDSITPPQRLMESLFKDCSGMSQQRQRDLAEGLYWIASDMQDVTVGQNFYDIFTYDELRQWWRTINSRMYVCNGNCPLASGVMMHCADNLLTNIIESADAALADGSISANLRFGHDTHLLRLLTLIGFEGCTAEETDFDKMHLVWQDYKLSPMAANLQIVFFKNQQDETIVKFLINETEAALPLESGIKPYYSWDNVRNYLLAKITQN